MFGTESGGHLPASPGAAPHRDAMLLEQVPRGWWGYQGLGVVAAPKPLCPSLSTCRPDGFKRLFKI